MDKKITIATHDGVFHPDDVFAVAALFMALEDAPSVPHVIRTRDEHTVRTADFALDVGAVYDPEKGRFDHHQIGGAGTRANGLSYAAFGLVWKQFGVRLAGSEEAALRIDKKLVATIDANDTGVDMYQKTLPDVSLFMVNDVVYGLRPTWQEDSKTTDTRFLEAVSFARKVLEREIAGARADIAAKEKVSAAYAVSEDKRLIILDAYYPWQETLSEFPEPLFVVFPRIDGAAWNVSAIRNSEDSFKNRKDLPQNWAGLRDADLAAVSGVSDAIFCHTGKFMAVARSKDGARALAKRALEV